jgi:hypothetical protein
LVVPVAKTDVPVPCQATPDHHWVVEVSSIVSMTVPTRSTPCALAVPTRAPDQFVEYPAAFAGDVTDTLGAVRSKANAFAVVDVLEPESVAVAVTA